MTLKNTLKRTTPYLIPFTIILLALTLLIKLIDQLKLLISFPGGFINDLSSYLAQLYFLDVCGFHQFCSYWYNGFTAFLITPPGWYFFTYPLYLLFGDVKIATYLSMILILLFSYLIIHHFGKKLQIPPLQRVLFFLLLFANANAIRGLFRSGRPHELLAWFLFLLLFFITLIYFNKKITSSFYFTSIIYAFLIITYFSVAIYAGLLFLSLFLVKKNKEKLQIVITVIIGFLLSSFWFVPFLKNIKGTFITTFYPSEWLLVFSMNSLFKQLGAILFPLAFFFVFYITWKQQKKNKKLLLFYTPFIILAALLFFRLTPFIPVLRNIPPTQYFTLFILLTGYLLITLKQQKTYLLLGLSIVALISTVIVLFFTTPYEVHNQDTQDLIELFPYIEGRYIALDLAPKEIYAKPLSAYAAIYHNLDNTLGWYPHVKEQTYFEKVSKLKQAFRERNCAETIKRLKQLNTTTILTHAGCDFLAKCEMQKVVEKHDYCAYSI
tara:strand:- start:5210 stop:6691 length:1482 start_codon:yes stop_codon:yes gene_type:complete